MQMPNGTEDWLLPASPFPGPAQVGTLEAQQQFLTWAVGARCGKSWPQAEAP